MTRTVDLGRFAEALGKTVHICTDNEHIKCTYHSGKNIHPEAVCKTQCLINKEYRDKTARNIHGDNIDQGQLFLENEILAA